MTPSFSLDYYHQIFGVWTPAYRELLAALSAELDEYAEAIGPVISSRDSESLARLRHSHRPMVENLKLTGLLVLEGEVKEALATGTTGPALADLEVRFVLEAKALARNLMTLQAGELPPDVPGPRQPVPGG